ncbi:hypothetical protein [Limosilactobacillus reuteri]|uniref:hypothetical protein n=1 Tax=Limosilactobacillus reuteri TaxID=1598 RepID=UPI001E4CABDB|nr:hypothetical protein [Limosilactobacillus reuteri]MCC4359313.1 hypothetical protein [Limosilactobacillus reuteri]MCC4363446.1 hypothetical protein [Limosilactobacillus reuteri]MCC4365094.1 hypothetical protein [Limosilactobacillus reuteri]
MLRNFFLRRKKYNTQSNLEDENEAEHQKLEKEIDEELKNGAKKFKQVNYNDWNFSTYQYVESLTNYLKKDIIYVYVLAKHADSDIDREIYANALCSNLCSFIDLYAQVLNIFYGLGLKPLRHNFSPTLLNPTTTIIDQAIDGSLEKCNKRKQVTNWNIIKQMIHKKYDEQNDYYKSTKALLDNDSDVTAMKNLRNYSVHYQPLFSRFELWSKNNHIIFNVTSNNTTSDQYQKFMDLAYRVIKKELLVIHYFEGMCFDQKMVPRDRENERVNIFKCDNCNSELMITDFLKSLAKEALKDKCELKILCERCKQYSTITDTGKSQIVHPEKYDHLVGNEVQNLNTNNMDIIDKDGKSIFQDVDDANA